MKRNFNYHQVVSDLFRSLKLLPKIEKNARIKYHLTESEAFGKNTVYTRGDVAQLGERSVRNAEVEGSNPFISTNALKHKMPLDACQRHFFWNRDEPPRTGIV